MTGIYRLFVSVFMIAAFAVIAPQAAASVSSVGKSGFMLRNTAHVRAKQDDVFNLLVHPARWWDSQHTFSGRASNLSVTPRAGACWCERLPGGGSIQHMVVVYVKEDETLRLRGALGPLQGLAVVGVLTWQLTRQGDTTNVVMEYAVGGYNPEGFAKLAKSVDKVLTEQMARLRRAAETGSPEVHGSGR
ncbi:MAG: SRPBCC family protein [Alphaproteobacteria bacterium]